MNFPKRFLKSTQKSSSVKIHPIGVELFHADRQRWTDITKPTVTFSNSAHVHLKALVTAP
jgi:hypothetical protein